MKFQTLTVCKEKGRRLEFFQHFYTHNNRKNNKNEPSTHYYAYDTHKHKYAYTQMYVSQTKKIIFFRLCLSILNIKKSHDKIFD